MADRTVPLIHIPAGATMSFDGKLFERHNDEWIRLDDSCTGVTAQWCPNHGDCQCPDRAESMDDPTCPLHSFASNHAEF